MLCFCDQLWGSNVSQSDGLDPYAFLGMIFPIYVVYFFNTFFSILKILKTLTYYKSIIQRANYITWKQSTTENISDARKQQIQVIYVLSFDRDRLEWTNT